MLGNILLWGILIYLVGRFLLRLFGIKSKVIIRVRPNNAIEGLLLPPELGSVRDIPEVGFIALMKARFAQISTAFAVGELKCVKNFLTPEVFQAFQSEINKRKELGQFIDFKLVDFKSVQVQDMKDQNQRWIEFETEQINLLKDKTGKVIEGNEMYLSQVREKWQFQWVEKQGWLLTAVEALDTHAI